MSRWAPTWRDATHDGCERRIAELESALREAVTTIEGLADQQAMADDWYREPLARLKAVAK